MNNQPPDKMRFVWTRIKYILYLRWIRMKIYCKSYSKSSDSNLALTQILGGNSDSLNSWIPATQKGDLACLPTSWFYPCLPAHQCEHLGNESVDRSSFCV